MINSKQIAIIKKDLKTLFYNKRLLPALLIVPLVFTVVMPSIFILSILFSPDSVSEFENFLVFLPMESQNPNLQIVIIKLIVNNILPMFFIIIPTMVATIMAASSFVGEKEKRTLETLFYSPLTIKEIFIAKVLSSFALSLFVTFISFIIMLIVVELEIFIITGSLLALSLNWLITLVLIVPAVSLIAITLIVRGSAKAQTIEEAQQKTVFLILPILLLIIGQFTGLIFVNMWLFLVLGLILVLIAFILMKASFKNFTYETLLK